jgi:hypothetical protein
VTGLEVAAHPVESVSAGVLTWPAERAAEVLEQFRRWTWDAPEALGAVFRHIALPGGPVVMVVAAYLGTEADARRIIDPLRGGVLTDTFGPVALADLVRVAGDPVEPMPTRGDGFLLRELDVDAVAGLLGEPGAPGMLEVRLLGGALARAPEGHGALGRLDGAFSLFVGSPAPDADACAALAERHAAIRERLAPWISPQAQLTAAGYGIDPASGFDAGAWERLQDVQRAYDPDGRIVTTHLPLAS